jgi:hypothetical protein
MPKEKNSQEHGLFADAFDFSGFQEECGFGGSQEEYSVRKESKKSSSPTGGGYPPGMAVTPQMAPPTAKPASWSLFSPRGRASAPVTAMPDTAVAKSKSARRSLLSSIGSAKNRATVAHAAAAPAYVPTSPPLAQAPTPSTLRGRTRALIAEQAFEGYFCLTVTFAASLNLSLSFLEAKLNELSVPLTEDLRRMFATMLAVGVFEGKLSGEKEMWELVVEKARGWTDGVQGVQVGAEKLKGLVEDVLSGLQS